MDKVSELIEEKRKELNDLILKKKTAIKNKENNDKKIEELNKRIKTLKKEIGDLYYLIDTINYAPKFFKKTKKKHIIGAIIAEIIFIVLGIVVNPSIICFTSQSIEFFLGSLGVVSLISIISYIRTTMNIKSFIKGKTIEDTQIAIKSKMSEEEKSQKELGLLIEKSNNTDLKSLDKKINDIKEDIIHLESIRNFYLLVHGNQLDEYLNNNPNIADSIIKLAYKRILKPTIDLREKINPS